jgi:rhamnosyltransferase
MLPIPDRKSTCGIIVTHNPRRDFGLLVTVLATQVGAIVIVDNASHSPPTPAVDGVRVPVTLIKNSENLGVAAALNQGVSIALASGFHFALTLDQDSVPGPDVLSLLAGVYANACRCFPVALVGSSFSPDFIPSRSAVPTQCGRAWVEKETVITSGSLMALEAYAVVGPFRDDLFIDHVDSEYCLRARTRGYAVVKAAEITMRHEIGYRAVHRLLGLSLATSNHSPLRRYYQARNLFVLIRTYYRTEPKWIAKALFSWTRSNVHMLMFESGRAKKLRGTLTGIVHGLAQAGVLPTSPSTFSSE